MPFDEGTDRELFDDSFCIASMSECTGLIPCAPEWEGEIRSYSDIYDIPLCDNLTERRDIMDDRNKFENKNQNKNQSQNKSDNKYDNKYDNKSDNKFDSKKNDTSNRKDR